MDASLQGPACRLCGETVTRTYCPNCGQKLSAKRITLPDLLHEVFHFFTHLDKGFPYTLKQLVKATGRMQKEYLEGDRSRHQKPFSMFFISATLSALVYYWVNRTLLQYWNAGDQHEAEFFNHYWVVLHSCLLPLYTLITYLCFRKAGYFYGEIAVFQLYTFSIVLLALALLQTGKFIEPSLETRYIEVPLLLGYTTVTNLRFFSRLKRLPIVLLSILNIGLTFLVAAIVQDALIQWLYKS
ncbi:MAG TPA: DUF3667 domain-containing protein [Flavisolibacter sp.]|nr:DUF3667 domain-containing protein [Flavisolibacter sp.]